MPSSILTSTSPVLSAQAEQFILSSERLRGALLPEGQGTSPYEILGYAATLTLHDVKGIRATYRRRQTIRFLQNGVSALLEHIWGDGLLFEYQNDVGRIADSIRDGKRRHLVIEFGRAMPKGSELRFGTVRRTLGGFTQPEEWLETTIDHPIRRLERRIVFPKGRPCQWATLEVNGGSFPLPISTAPGDRTAVSLKITQPQPNLTYRIRWRW